jgi:hypothetical protein
VGCSLALGFHNWVVVCCQGILALFRTLEANVELLHVVVDQSDFIVAHQHLHDVCLDSALWTRHDGGVVLFLAGWVWCFVWRANQVSRSGECSRGRRCLRPRSLVADRQGGWSGCNKELHSKKQAEVCPVIELV